MLPSLRRGQLRARRRLQPVLRPVSVPRLPPSRAASARGATAPAQGLVQGGDTGTSPQVLLLQQMTPAPLQRWLELERADGAAALEKLLQESLSG